MAGVGWVARTWDGGQTWDFRPSGTSCCRGASVKMPLVGHSQDGLVPQLQANLTRWPQLPRRASVLSSRPAGARRPHTGRGGHPLTGPTCSCGRAASPSCCHGLRLYFMVWLLGLRRARHQQDL